MLSRDRQNLMQFSKAMDHAYAKAKQGSLLDPNDIRHYDKLMTVGPIYNGELADKPIFVHRRWRRRVARMYYRQKYGRMFGIGIDFDINWNDVFTWIMENIVPIMKMLFAILPFLI